jgi:hypothetical protein
MNNRKHINKNDPISVTGPIYTFLLAYTGKEMKDLPDLMLVIDGVDIRIDLGHILGGWTLQGSKVVAVWFVKLTDGTYAKLKG